VVPASVTAPPGTLTKAPCTPSPVASPHHTGSLHEAAAVDGEGDASGGSVGRSHDATSRTSAIDRATHMPSQRTDGANGYEAMYNSGSGRLEEMTIILVMTETLALAQVKARFSELADRVES